MRLGKAFRPNRNASKDVAAIDAGVAKLNNDLAAQDLNYFSALGIHQSAINLDNTIKTATTNVNALSADEVTEADAQEVLNTLTGTEVNVKSASQRLIAQKPNFDRLGVTGLARDDTNNLARDTKTYGAALLSKTPASLKTDASTLLDKVNADLAEAVTAYA
ncbi:Cell wall galactomannoprotein [Ceraceosorus bombacis]|uniref:Cell wall galactomannoprotein n=1 Tax=Ceraceosorus bombacis TaxID=401625 RepID=A0A0P1BRK4_9BASI|nr:Cell wall galactomannoprotein [Ceraceosorus bombacis]